MKRTESIADRFFAAISARNRRSLSSIFLIIFLSLGSIGLHAQTTFGTFLGTVQDQSGAVIANATVTMLNLGTAATRTVHTEADGTYNFVNVEPGNYKLSVEAKGFKRAIFSLTLAARQSIRVDASLQVGAQDQSVEVHGSFTVINTDVSNLAETKTGLELIDLPVAITSRGSGSTSPYSTLTMQPGIQTDNAGNISVSGAKPGTLSISIDGISTMDPRLSTPLTELFPSFNAIAEIRVGSVNNSAEYGGVSDITTTSKGGSNTLQGGVFEINQEADYDAKSPFALKKPSLIMN
ncbi:MAG: carboxypeptidase regulatory-like domain-containing protein, partial [Candidatus Korobacteraceae bacterium]